MIGFMQKHRKYLVVVVWASTIAFVGAGFVGWGSYSLSSSANAVAIVGDTNIEQNKLQREYNRLYNIYNQLVGGTLDQEQAKKMGIESQALNNLISQTLMLNFARDIGLRVEDKEIIEEITTIEAFQSNGKFNQEIYKKALQENQLRPKEFEESIRESLLLNKLGVLLDIPLTQLEIDVLKSAYFAEDKVAIKTINKSSIEFTPKEEGIKQYWEENKDIYQTQRGYEISMLEINTDSIETDEENLKKYYNDFKNKFLDNNGQIKEYKDAKNDVIREYKDSQAEKEALKEYISLRKGENKNAKNIQVFEGDNKYNIDFINALSQAKEGETLKPIKLEDRYITAKIIKIIPSMPKEYSVARDEAKEDYIKEEKSKTLQSMAEKELKTNFDATNIGFISKDTRSIQGLNEDESLEFVSQLFGKTDEKGYILLQNKIVLYKILDQRIKNSDTINENLELLTQSGNQMKGRLVEKELLSYLLNTYEVIKK